MDIHDIKPPGSNGSLIGSDYQNLETAPGKNFAAAKDKVQTRESEGTASPGLTALANCSKAELEDPEKLKAIVRASAAELVDQGQNITGPLSPAQKESIVDFLTSDPIIGRQLENYVRKALA
ncbi:MAG TPA: hypothetical protein VFA67_13775 [Candidatus Sulfotelmatobacter sp.]|jgi:hypothetical protein|nr:hypothetical protein [Candidatus Sulfotelmatobacter sp.]